MNEKFGSILEEFTNALGVYCAFTDDGIVCKNTSTNSFFPYGSIEKIGFSLGSLDITGEVNGEPQCFLYVPVDKQQKARIKELISFAKSKMKNAPKEDAIEITPKKTGKEAEEAARNAVAQAHASRAVAMMDTEKRKEAKRSETVALLLIGAILIVICVCVPRAIIPCLFLGLALYIGYLVIHKEVDKQLETSSTRFAQTSIYSFEKKYHNMGYIGVLRVGQKSEKAINALEFKEIHDINVSTTPDKLVYTGATVGGVTTGGFHVQKGGTSVSIGAGTGSWAVTYRFAREVNGEPWGDTVVYMQLADQLFTEAKQDAILQKLIVTKEERQKWREISSTEELADVPSLLCVIGMDEQTANYLKNWLAGLT